MHFSCALSTTCHLATVRLPATLWRILRLDGWVAGVNIGFCLASNHRCLELDQGNGYSVVPDPTTIRNTPVPNPSNMME